MRTQSEVVERPSHEHRPVPPPAAAAARGFIGDVFINVLANLIAGAIIYLGGVDAGLFQANLVLVLVSAAIGLIAVSMVIAGGSSYMRSDGDSGLIARAKNRIIYGVVGGTAALLVTGVVWLVLSLT
ncbi:hypothetical protein [Plantactinospora soyae]|uniref:Uncharacterized protein n=1 Tax=Plantactinospora soyae TaxID=1544732 RepID=A0A927LZY5_9ACTN|nr:hypothetical protein [Plantactinospora soyae]MBE1485602.1 hypothetical protein [Plantactinospora soyae]